MYKKFDELFIDETKYGTKIKTDQYLSEGKYPIVDQGQKKFQVIQILKMVYLKRYRLLYLEIILD